MVTKIVWDKVTWYSKLLADILFVATFYIGFQLGVEKTKIATPVEITKEQKQVELIPLAIDNKEINEENFTGKTPVIIGSDMLATEARKYINDTFQEFKTQADTDVPEMKKQFGAENPTTNYTLNIEAKYIQNINTNSLVLIVYTYTGGAHGNSNYKVFTAPKNNEKILALSDILKTEKKQYFIETVRKHLMDWRPDGALSSPLFTDLIGELTLEDFSNWSMDEENLTIYFSQYAIGPGVLGQVAFNVPIEKIKGFLLSDF